MASAGTRLAGQPARREPLCPASQRRVVRTGGRVRWARNARAPPPSSGIVEEESHMIPSIDVFFEFSSPYSYLAAQELPALVTRHGRPLRWRPIELAKVWGAQGVLEAYAAVRRVKKDYIMRDAARVAADRNLSFVPFRSPPDATLARLVVHRLNRRAPAAAEPFVLETWRKLFGKAQKSGRSTCSHSASSRVCIPKSSRPRETLKPPRIWRSPMAMRSPLAASGFPGSSLTTRPISARTGSISWIGA